MTPEKTIQKLNWRYATKAFDTSRKLSADQVHMLKEALRLAPSSGGIQPWKFIEVKSSEMREKIKLHAWNQPQITEASNFFVLCIRTDLDEMHINAHIERTAKMQATTVEALQGYKDMLMGILQGNHDKLAAWASRQLYIPLGMMLAVAAINDIDACPMEGFDHDAVDALLGLKARQLASVGFCAVGYRKIDDPAAGRPKVRFAEEEVFIEL